MKKYISLILVVVLMLSVLAGCGKPVDVNNNVVNGEFTEYLVAEKVGTLNRDNFTTAEGGIYYKDDNGLYGVMSFNGARDTGAIYTDVKPVGKYFQVRTKAVTGTNDFDGINASSLIDGKGKTIIPEGYASYYNLNDRYVKIAKVTERSYSKEDTVVTRNNETGLCFDGAYSDNYDWYMGNWYVFDTVTEKLVPGATGATDTIVSASGRYVKFKNAAGDYIEIDENGEPLPEGAHLFGDGSYSVEGKIGEVYGSDGSFLFNYDLTGFVPSNESNGYYVASKYMDGSSKYVVMDKKGKVISSEFDKYISIYGEVVHCDDKVYNLEGKCILE